LTHNFATANTETTTHKLHSLTTEFLLVPSFQNCELKQEYKDIQDSIDYVYKVKNNTQLRAKRLYEKYGWSKEECISIAKGYIFMGMTKEQLIMAWGKPKDINRTVTRYSTDEQWVYGDFGPYVYLKDGVVTSWQD